jgi:ABC-type branched-subunit amino acid transport system substrate-binding protein
MSGKFQVVGEAVLRAAMLAAGTPGPGPGGVQLVLRDTVTDADRASRGVAELTRTEAVIGIVGAAGAKTGGAAIAQATQDGIAMLALEDVAPGAPTTAFQMVHSPEARAAALARRALKLGVRRFAILGPDSASAKRLREAFRRVVGEGGGAVVVESSYVAGATSFSGALGPLKKVAFQAVFVPDSAERLGLIAPALAVADLWPQPWNKARVAVPSGKDQPRPILLLSTANELSHRLLDNGGRYVQGSLLCPGFFADDAEPRARGFVESYRATYGQDPHATEAYAYDAVTTLRALTQQGARTRSDVVKALGVGAGVTVLQGLTGNVTFGPDHGRADEPLVYLVDGDDVRIAR